jgi:hypothetical protein
MDDKESKTKVSDHLWAWTGKLAALLGLVLLATQIIDRFQTPEYALSASARHYFLLLPDSVSKFLIREAAAAEVAYQRAADSNQDTVRLAARMRFIRDIQKMAQSKEAFLVTITNDGTKQISGAVLETGISGVTAKYPGSGYEDVLRKLNWGLRGSRQPVVSFADSIPLQPLRPGNQVSLLIWNEREFEQFDEKRFRVTHPNGAVNVRFEPQLDYLPVRNSGRIWLGILTLVLLGSIILVLLGISRAEAREKRGKKETEARLARLEAATSNPDDSKQSNPEGDSH